VVNRQQQSKQEKRKPKVNQPKPPVAQTSPFARPSAPGPPRSTGRKSNH
jgi:hypothetical protein